MDLPSDFQTPTKAVQPPSPDLPSHVSIPTELYCILLKSALSDIGFGNSPDHTSPIDPNATNAVLNSLKTPSRLDESSHRMNLLLKKYLSDKHASQENPGLKNNLKDSVNAVRERLVEHFNLISSTQLLQDTTINTINNNNGTNMTPGDTSGIGRPEDAHIPGASPSRWLSPDSLKSGDNLNTSPNTNINTSINTGINTSINTSISNANPNTNVNTGDGYDIAGILRDIKCKFDRADAAIEGMAAQLDGDVCDPNKREWEFSSFMGPAGSGQSVIFEHARALYTNLYNHAKTNELRIAALREKLAVLQAHVKPASPDHRNAL